MKITINALLALLVAATTSVASDIVSTFDSSDEGWKVIVLPDYGPYSAISFGPLSPTFSPSGGNPGGYILSADPQGIDGTFYFEAPAPFLGDRSSSYGLRISYDVKTSGGGQEWKDADMVLVGRNGVILVIATAFSPTTDWRKQAVVLHESAGWRIGALNGPIPSRTQFMRNGVHPRELQRCI